MAFAVTATPTPAGSANPNPAYAGTFIPVHWSGKLAERLYENTFLSRITTMGFGDLDANGLSRQSLGDTIKVRMPPGITIRTYQSNQAIVAERPAQSVTNVLLDTGLYFDCIIDDVHRRQADFDLADLWAEGASRDLKVKLEEAHLPVMVAGVAATNMGIAAGTSGDVNLGSAAAPLVVTQAPGNSEASPIRVLARLAQVLDELGVPNSGRWVLVPPWFAAELEITPQVLGGGAGGYEGGLVCRACRFDVYQTVNLPPSGASFPILAGHMNATAFVSQLSELELINRESTFGKDVRGLDISGLDVVQPKGLALAYVSKGLTGVGTNDASTFLFRDSLPVTPSDSTVLPPNIGLRVTTTGNLSITPVASTTARNWGTATAGEIIPGQIAKVNAATTAVVLLLTA